jgi:outer membrane lipoprotein-sorting protein
LIFILLGFTGLWCLENPAEDLRKELLENYSTIETFEAEFRQLNYWQELDTELTSTGKIYFDNDNLKLEYSSPAGQFLILDSLQVTMYDPGSNQAIISSSKEIDIRPRSIILKYWQDSLLVSCKRNMNKAEVELRTEAGDQIGFLVENNLITELSYTDTDSNRVIYSFSTIELNKLLPVEIFEVKLPEDVNLLDTRK